MNTKALWSVAVLGTVTALFAGCGDGDSTKIKICNAKQTVCLNDRDAEVCSADGTLKLPFSCGEGERCCDPKKDDECKDANGDLVEETSCVGACEPGESKCGSSVVSLVCNANGDGWSTVVCPAGTGCDPDDMSDTAGTCVRSDENPQVTICETGETACAGSGTLKTCEEDGSNWVYSDCAANEDCTDGACVLNPDKGCEPHAGTCVDLTHVKYCNDDGNEYGDIEECPDGTSCEDGGCQGPVCTVGDIRCDDVRVGTSYLNAIQSGSYRPQALYTCNADGTAWEISTCASDELCIYDNISVNTVNEYIEALKSRNLSGSTLSEYPTLAIPDSAKASCQQPGCASPYVLREIFGASYSSPYFTGGSFTCGNPDDADSDFLDSFSLCEGLPPFNNLHWANYGCTAPEQCTYLGSPSNSEETSSYIVGPTCSTSCKPDSTACYSETNFPGVGAIGGISATGEWIIKCNDEGEWDYGTRERCVSDDKKNRELWCGPNLMGTDSFNVGTCMEPACAAWFSVYDTFALPEDVGACGTDGKFYRCKADGTFDAGTTCSNCQLAESFELPQVTGLDETFAGYEPGKCITCTEGEQYCLFSDNTTPYYQECSKGKWTTKSCSGNLCTSYNDPDEGQWSIICGADCRPFSAECGGVEGKQVRACDEDGKRPDEFEDCSIGACHTDDQSSGAYGGSAVCEAECIQNSVICDLVDTDEDDIPEVAEIKCSNKLRYETANATACDVSDPAALEKCVDKIGCVECDPGTFSGQPDVRCAVDEDGLQTEDPQVQVCKPDGTWADPIDCPGETPVCSFGLCSDLGGAGGAGGQGNQ